MEGLDWWLDCKNGYFIFIGAIQAKNQPLMGLGYRDTIF
jgi:hypothetical protein